METTETNAPAESVSDAGQAEPVSTDGQASAPVSDEGQSVANTDTTSTGEDKGKPPAEEERIPAKQYKELQREFTKRNEAFKKLNSHFSKYGGIQKALQEVEQLSNPEIRQLIEERKAAGDRGNKRLEYAKILGITKDDLDSGIYDDNIRALETVESLSSRVAEAKVAKVMEALKSAFNPLFEKQKREHVDRVMGDFGKKYPSWKEHEPLMMELAKANPSQNPTVDYVEDLYWQAIRRSGKMDDVMAKTYEKKLMEKKNKAVDRPKNIGGGESSKKVMSMRDALLNAKHQLGM